MKITELQLRNIIVKTINESIFVQGEQQNPFVELDNKAIEKATEIENEIEALQNQVNILMSVGNICNNVDARIKEEFQGIQGPKEGKYNNSFEYVFSQPIPYNEETYKYGNLEEGFEYNIKELFPEEIKDSVSIYPIEKDNVLYGFEIWIELDDIEGWY